MEQQLNHFEGFKNVQKRKVSNPLFLLTKSKAAMNVAGIHMKRSQGKG